MILHALHDYYHRKAALNDGSMPLPGLEWKKLPFIIVIDADGRFINLEDTREGGKDAGKKFLVPRSKTRTSPKAYEIAFLLWDHRGYVLGYEPNDKSIGMLRLKSFINEIRKLPPEVLRVPQIAAVVRFYEQQEHKKVLEHAAWADCKKTGRCNMSFRMMGEGGLVCDCPELHAHIAANPTGQNEKKIVLGSCLITGKIGPIARIHQDTRIRAGEKDKKAKKLVGFQKKSGYDSYNKEQAFNAPVGESAEFAYTTALNVLLNSPRNRLRFIVGDAVTVFWAQRPDDFEKMFSAFFETPPEDDPDADMRAVQALYQMPYDGKGTADEENRFYVLGLSPNVARIAVRFWHQGTIPQFAAAIRRHFDDLDIVRPAGDEHPNALFRLLSAVAQEDKAGNIPPNLAGDIVNAVLSGGPYPATLLQQTLRRIRADLGSREKQRSRADRDRIGRIRAALLKAYINRFQRSRRMREKELAVSLDTQNENIGYRLGRLFAVLEKIQKEAQPGLNAGIRERSYGAASSRPTTVFPRLLVLKNHHLAKLSAGRKINMERLIGSIAEELPPDWPAYLSLEDQARFAVGYYHQTQDFFTAKDKE